MEMRLCVLSLLMPQYHLTQASGALSLSEAVGRFLGDSTTTSFLVTQHINQTVLDVTSLTMYEYLMIRHSPTFRPVFRAPTAFHTRKPRQHGAAKDGLDHRP